MVSLSLAVVKCAQLSDPYLSKGVRGRRLKVRVGDFHPDISGLQWVWQKGCGVWCQESLALPGAIDTGA